MGGLARRRGAALAGVAGGEETREETLALTSSHVSRPALTLFHRPNKSTARSAHCSAGGLEGRIHCTVSKTRTRRALVYTPTHSVTLSTHTRTLFIYTQPGPFCTRWMQPSSSTLVASRQSFRNGVTLVSDNCGYSNPTVAPTSHEARSDPAQSEIGREISRRGPCGPPTAQVRER